MTRSKKEVLEALFDPKIIHILSFLMNQNKDTYLKEISDSTNVPQATALRILHQLENHSLISVTKVGRTKLYRWAAVEDTEFLSDLLRVEQNPLEPVLVHAGTDPNIDLVVLHGKINTDKANVLVIGKDIDSTAVQNVVTAINEKHNMTVHFMCLDKQQFAQMTGMGLYSGKKTVLYKK